MNLAAVTWLMEGNNDRGGNFGIQFTLLSSYVRILASTGKQAACFPVTFSEFCSLVLSAAISAKEDDLGHDFLGGS
jgi:hypothetical protein